MFGMGMTEILVILVVAVIFLGPDKLPEAASKISKGIRDIRKQTRDLQQTIENDTEIGGAIRELKSALRGDELLRPAARKPPAVPAGEAAHAAGAVLAEQVTAPELPAPAAGEPSLEAPSAALAEAPTTMPAMDPDPAAAPAAPAPPTITLPPTAGERASDEPAVDPADEAAELARLIRPAAGTAKREGHG